MLAPTPPGTGQTLSDQQRLVEMEVQLVRAERLVFFSDAVVAIAITLLALDLPVPPTGSNLDVLHFASNHLPAYRAFLISFVVIGAHRSRCVRLVGSASPTDEGTALARSHFPR